MRLFGFAWFGLETFSTESSGLWADLSRAKRVQRPGLLESMVLGAARLYKAPVLQLGVIRCGLRAGSTMLTKAAAAGGGFCSMSRYTDFSVHPPLTAWGHHTLCVSTRCC